MASAHIICYLINQALTLRSIKDVTNHQIQDIGKSLKLSNVQKNNKTINKIKNNLNRVPQANSKLTKYIITATATF